MLDLLKEILKQSNHKYDIIIEKEKEFIVNGILFHKKFLHTDRFKNDIIADVKLAKKYKKGWY